MIGFKLAALLDERAVSEVDGTALSATATPVGRMRNIPAQATSRAVAKKAGIGEGQTAGEAVDRATHAGATIAPQPRTFVEPCSTNGSQTNCRNL